MNADLLRAGVERVRQDPESWDQRRFANITPCGTTFCFAGHIVLAAGHRIVRHAGTWFVPPDWRGGWASICEVAVAEAGLTEEQASRLFFELMTDDLDVLAAEVEAIIEEATA